MALEIALGILLVLGFLAFLRALPTLIVAGLILYLVAQLAHSQPYYPTVGLPAQDRYMDRMIEECKRELHATHIWDEGVHECFHERMGLPRPKCNWMRDTTKSAKDC